MAWRWTDLDTGLLHRILTLPYSYYGTSLDGAHVVFTSEDTVWLPTDHGTWVEVLAAGTAGNDYFAAVRLLDANAASLASVSPSYWPDWTNWLDLNTNHGWSTDTEQVLFRLPQRSQWPLNVELAIAGTCAGQREFLHLGGSDRQKLPHGNVAPLDGFVCEVQTDTISFPLGQ